MPSPRAREARMRLLSRLEMPPSNRLGINDNEDHERSPGRLQYQPRSAPPSHGAPVHIQADKGIPRHMALGAPSPVEHPGRNLQEAVCLRTVQSAAEKHAIGLLDDRVNPHLVRKPGMMRVQNLTPDGLAGVLKSCC